MWVAYFLWVLPPGTPPGSYGEELAKILVVTILKYSQCILHNKKLLYGQKYFTKTLLTLGEGQPNSNLCIISISPKEEKVKKKNCDGHSPGTKAHEKTEI